MALGSEHVEELVGAKVVGIDGSRIGRVVAVHGEDGARRSLWAVICSGRFGQGLIPVPLADADVQGDVVRVPYPAAIVHDAPRVESIASLSEKQQRGLYRYYQASASDSGFPMKRR